jgi:hypothetical protein
VTAPLPDKAPVSATARPRLDKSKLLATVVGAGARIAANALLLGTFGLLLNAALLWLSWGALEDLTRLGSGAGPAHGGGGGAGAALVLVLFAFIYWKSILAGMVLMPGFPLAWLLVGKKRGVDSAVKLVVTQYKDGLVELLVEKVVRRLRTPEWAERFNRSGLRATLNELLPRYLAKLDDLPALARPVLRALVGRVDVGGFLLKVFEERQVAELDPEVLGEMAAARANEFIDEKLLAVSWRPVQVLLGANLAFVALVFLLSR